MPPTKSKAPTRSASLAKLTEEGTEEAVEALLQGSVIGLPTETVYGLAADATNECAVAKIFSIKYSQVRHKTAFLWLGDRATDDARIYP
jgi:tRNA A37 threonylcarbamoyladenosine synthetase subunit TsaC/SUA5/YrdC